MIDFIVAKTRVSVIPLHKFNFAFTLFYLRPMNNNLDILVE